MAIKWYSLFSHTGRETETLYGALWGTAELVMALTDNPEFRGVLPRVKLRARASIYEWLTTPGNVEPGSIVTLNGFMGIIPKRVLDYFRDINVKVYNVHPAPIHLYPELRGKDPQPRMLNGIRFGKYDTIGVVIHAVDEGVDTGPIVRTNCMRVHKDIPTHYMYECLRRLSIEAWLSVFQKEVWLHEQACASDSSQHAV